MDQTQTADKKTSFAHLVLLRCLLRGGRGVLLRLVVVDRVRRDGVLRPAGRGPAPSSSGCRETGGLGRGARLRRLGGRLKVSIEIQQCGNKQVSNLHKAPT